MINTIRTILCYIVICPPQFMGFILLFLHQMAPETFKKPFDKKSLYKKIPEKILKTTIYRL